MKPADVIPSTAEMTGAFITFEGIDGCGKSTQLRLLANEIHRRGIKVVSTREPGGTTLGKRLRAALLDVEEQVDPLAELLVFAADRAHHVRTLLLPALKAGEIVLSDRYADATVAYQGAGRGFEPTLIQEIVQLATGGLTPNLTLLFDLSVAESGVRTRRRVAAKNTDRLDIEDAAFHTRVRNAYLEIAKAHTERIRVIDARGSAQQTHQAVIDIVMPFLEERGMLEAVSGNR
ncbi:MAG: dTMP kinase [Acidobacteriota bacterium]